MFNDYSDITERIAEPPLWWDEQGVPRYAEFEPHLVANIYAREVALMEVACSQCWTRFRAAVSTAGVLGEPDRHDLAESIETRTISYGDPPNYRNYRSGPSSSCYDLRVLQYWLRPAGWGEWVRDSRFEIDLPDLDVVDKPQ
jgi:hypothetical protein